MIGVLGSKFSNETDLLRRGWITGVSGANGCAKGCAKGSARTAALTLRHSLINQRTAVPNIIDPPTITIVNWLDSSDSFVDNKTTPVTKVVKPANMRMATMASRLLIIATCIGQRARCIGQFWHSTVSNPPIPHSQQFARDDFRLIPL